MSLLGLHFLLLNHPYVFIREIDSFVQDFSENKGM